MSYNYFFKLQISADLQNVAIQGFGRRILKFCVKVFPKSHHFELRLTQKNAILKRILRFYDFIRQTASFYVKGAGGGGGGGGSSSKFSRN